MWSFAVLQRKAGAMKGEGGWKRAEAAEQSNSGVEEESVVG